jgi:hypothetical protein
MSTGHHLLWLAEQSLLIYALPFHIALLVIIILFARTSYPIPKGSRLLPLLGSLQLLIPVATILLGAFFEHRQSAQPEYTKWLLHSILLLFAFQIPIGIYILLRVKQSRILVASLSVIQLFVSFNAMLVASMSIGGDWM